MSNHLKDVIKGKIKVYFIFHIFLFISFTLYAYFIFGPELYYFKRQQLFLFDPEYFKKFLVYPGGISDYLSSFITQFYSFKIVGAFLFSFFLISIYSLIVLTLKKVKDFPFHYTISFLPFGIFLLLQNDYDYHLSIHVKFIISLLFFLFYLHIRPHTIKQVLLIPFLGVAYFISGGLFFLFLLGLVFFYEFIFSKGKLKIVVLMICLISGFLVPYLAVRYFFMIPLREAYLYMVPFSDLFRSEALVYSALLSFPFVFIIFRFLPIRENLLHHIKFPILAELFIVFIGSFIILFVSFNREKRLKVEIDYLADHQQWGKMIHLPLYITREDMLNNFDVTFINNFNMLRAFYHTGQLLDRLFDQEQFLGIDGLFINKELGSNITIPTSGLYFELGHINAAKMYCYEALTSYPYDPRIYKRLVLIHLINKEYSIAEKFIKSLKKSILTRKWANHYGQYLRNHVECDMDSLLMEKRSCIPQIQFFIQMNNPYLDLNHLLSINKNNKMAFEYLLAHYLLSKNWNGLISYIEQFDRFGDAQLPNHIEEALLIVPLLYPDLWQKNPSLKKIRIEGETIKCFEEFNKIIYRYRDNPERVVQILPERLKKTYWFYLMFTSQKSNLIRLGKKKRYVD